MCVAAGGSGAFEGAPLLPVSGDLAASVWGARSLCKKSKMPRPCAVETRVGRYTDGLSDKDWMPRARPVEIHVQR